MTISQTTITGSIKTPAGVDAKLTAVTFTLSKPDFENGSIIAVRKVEATIEPETGEFSATLWPNDRGLNGDTLYGMEFKFGDGEAVSGLNSIRVKYSDTPANIEDVVAETKLAGAVKPYALKIVRRSAFDPEAALDPNTVYLILEG